MLRRLISGMIVVALAAAAGWALRPATAVARPGGVKLKLAQGSLSIDAPQVKAIPGLTSRAAVVVTDARGTGAGWSLKLSAARAATVSRVVTSCAVGSTCTLPRAQAFATGSTVLRVKPGSGMGVVKITVTFTLARKGASAGAVVPVTFTVSS